jgi:hypothetical protein
MRYQVFIARNIKIMESVRISEMSVYDCKATVRHIPEGCRRHKDYLGKEKIRGRLISDVVNYCTAFVSIPYL